jgi:hypothetical protein
MVDLSLLQSVSYIAGALGVCVAAFYYVTMVRINQRALKISMTNNLLQFFSTVEGWKIWGEIMNMTWKDYEDFEKKYGSDYNLDNFAKRHAVWVQLDLLGDQLRAGDLDRETIYTGFGTGATWIWAKFKPVFDENRRRYNGKDSWVGLEYLAGEMLKMKLERNPSFKIPETFYGYVSE